MRATTHPTLRRIVAFLAFTIALFAVLIAFFPDVLPIYPAAIVPALWVAFFGGGNGSAHERRVLVAFLVAGVLLFGLGLMAYFAVD